MDSTSTRMRESARWQRLAVACVLLAWVWLVILMSGAWKLSIAFAVAGCLAAIAALRAPAVTARDRVVLTLCLLLGLAAIGFAVPGWM